MDGEITIGTNLSTDKFDKQIVQLEKKMQKEEDKKIIIKTQLDTQTRELEEARAKTDELADAYQRLKEITSNLNTFKARFAEYGEIKSQFGNLQEIERSFNTALNRQDALEQKVARTELRYKDINQRVDEYKQKVEGIKMQKQIADVDKLKESFKNVGSSIQSSLQNSIKSVARLALGIFGVRSAYLALRRASSDLASYDKQYAANIEYIRYALTQAIAPVLRWIVQMAATLLGYLNAILQGWFGINLFSRGSAENFNKMKKSTSGVSKAVKKIKKQLAGFDEINMLTDQSDTGTKAGAGVPEFDLSKFAGEPPEWLKWIIDHKDLILAILAGVVAGLAAIKLGLGGIKALGIGLLVAGIVTIIQGLIEYLKDPSWENFGKVIQGIGLVILGLGVIIGGVPAIVAGAIVLILGTIIKYWKNIKDFIQKGIDWLTGKSDWVHKKFGEVVGAIYDFFVQKIQIMLNFVDGRFKALKQIFDGVIKFVKGVFTGNWKQAWEGIKQIFSGIINGVLNKFNLVINTLKNKLALWGKVAGNIFGGAFKGVVNAVLRAIEGILNTPIRAINGLIGLVNKIPGVSINTLSTFDLPRLASGGIVNMPNRGTLVGPAIAGESGREGVVPLTDQQAMAELGREIGKNVLVNLTNITTMNGRVISRELKQVQSEQDFAFNM